MGIYSGHIIIFCIYMEFQTYSLPWMTRGVHMSWKMGHCVCFGGARASLSFFHNRRRCGNTMLMQARAPVCICLLRWVCAGTLPSWWLTGGGWQRPVTEVDTHGRLYGLKLDVAVDTSDRNERARSSATMRLRRCSVYRVATATTLLPELRGDTAEPLTPFSCRSLPISKKLAFSFICYFSLRIEVKLRNCYLTDND